MREGVKGQRSSLAWSMITPPSRSLFEHT
uniref:Uncharacterized protein n=1 Tax=Anguilla anguilla TaxID=7936 RepID=A0A0E9RHE6_ANGAN